jgi:hypothetical protein
MAAERSAAGRGDVEGRPSAIPAEPVPLERAVKHRDVPC